MPSQHVVLVTGAASGIGAATARAFAARGDLVVLADRDREALDATAAALPGEGHLAVPTDIADPSATDSLAARARERFGGLDVVHANAGVTQRAAALVDTPPEVVERVLAVNVAGTFNTLRSCVPVLRDGGAVVVTASVSGLLAHPQGAAYAASKIALIGLGRALAAELAPRGIRVNCVCPGGVDTPLVREMEFARSMEASIEEYEAVNPLGRIADPADVAEAVLFLADARQVTGVALRVDGGDGLNGFL